MSEFNEDHSANKTPGEGSQPALPHHESPSMVPDERARSRTRRRTRANRRADAEPVDPSEISIPSRAIEPASRAARGTVLLLDPSRGRGGRTGTAAGEATPLRAQPCGYSA